MRGERLLPGSAAVGRSRPIASSIWPLRSFSAAREVKPQIYLLSSLLASIKLRYAVDWCEEQLLRFLVSSVLHWSPAGFVQTAF